MKRRATRPKRPRKKAPVPNAPAPPASTPTAAAGAAPPPSTLNAAAEARRLEVLPLLERRGPVDAELLRSYCQIYARWKQAEDTIGTSGQVMRDHRGRLVASPLVAIANQTAGQVRALEQRLGLSGGLDDPADPSATAGALLTRAQLATALRVHRQTVTKWEQAGMPVASRGSKGRASHYREADVRAWIQARDESAKETGGAVDLVRDRARRERAQATLAEQTFQMRSRELLPRAEVERAWESEIVAVRAKLLQIAPTYADRVYQAAVTEGVMGVERVLGESVNDVLLELAGEAEPIEVRTA